MYDTVKEYINDLEFVKGRNNITDYGRKLLDEIKELLIIAEQEEYCDSIIDNSDYMICSSCGEKSKRGRLCSNCYAEL